VAYRAVMQRLRPLSEAECYLRCYGQRRTEFTVRVVKPEPVRAVEGGSVGDRIRQLFEAALDAREPEPA
jgi:hypothetical protein